MTTSTTAAPARPRAKSRATRAAEKAAEGRPNLTVVPDPPPAPAPAGIDAITARLSSALNLGQPDPPPASVINRSAQAATQARPRPAENTNPDGTKKGTPQAKAAAVAARAQATQQVKDKATRTRQAKVTSKVSGLPVNAKAGFTTKDRFIGTVTVATAPAKPGGEPDVKVYCCEHDGRNGHITEAAALTCAGRLLRNHAGGAVGTKIRLRYWGQYQATAEGSAPVSCGCRFGHKAEESAVACAKVHAAHAGLNAG